MPVISAHDHSALGERDVSRVGTAGIAVEIEALRLLVIDNRLETNLKEHVEAMATKKGGKTKCYPPARGASII